LNQPRFSRPPRLISPLRASRFFVNLTNGLEGVPVLEASGLPFTFCRLQSSLCESQAMEALVAEADTHLLFSLACGHACFVLDYASRNKKRGVPRALWYGLEFLCYACDSAWLGAPQRPPVLRGFNVEADFGLKLGRFSKQSWARLKYFRKFVDEARLRAAGGVQLYGVCAATERDGDTEFYRAAAARLAAEEPVLAGAPRADLAAAALGRDAAERLRAAGLEVFSGSLGHSAWRVAQVAERAAAAAADSLQAAASEP